jgi:hypothetical protein
MASAYTSLKTKDQIYSHLSLRGRKQSVKDLSTIEKEFEEGKEECTFKPALMAKENNKKLLKNKSYSRLTEQDLSKTQQVVQQPTAALKRKDMNRTQQFGARKKSQKRISSPKQQKRQILKLDVTISSGKVKKLVICQGDNIEVCVERFVRENCLSQSKAQKLLIGLKTHLEQIQLEEKAKQVML